VRRFRVACSRCELELFFVDQIGDDELSALRQHLRAAHPADALPDDAPAGAVLRHFTVREVT
jgi:hypothetical protein